MTTLLIVDLSTHRIVWFTDDLTYRPDDLDQAVIVEHDGELPAGLTERTSWSYRYLEGKILEPAPTVTQAAKLLDMNRESIRKEVLAKHSKRVSDLFGSVGALAAELFAVAEARLWIGPAPVVRSRWVLHERELGGYASVEGAAHAILDRHDDKSEAMFRLEGMRLKCLELIDGAATNDELLEARKSCLEMLNS